MYFQAPLHGFNATSIETSYDLFDFAFIVAMECHSEAEPKTTRITENENICTSQGFYYDEQTGTMLSLKVRLLYISTFILVNTMELTKISKDIC